MPISMMSIGYAEKTRRQTLTPLSASEDVKPDIDEMVTWL